MWPIQPTGYLALPATGKGRPVLVLHAWWGLNDTIKGLCNRLAEAGFVAFAADLYHGKVTNQISEAEKLGGALDQNVDQARAEILAATAFLRQHAKSEEIGIAVIGFSLGAFYAADLSTTASDAIRKVVLFYGSGPGDYSKSKAAYLGHYAEHDPYEDPSYAVRLETELKALGRPVNFYTYAGTSHWFFEPDRADVYNAEAATLAWERTLAFLRGRE